MKIIFIIPSITNYHTFLSELSDNLLAEGHDVFLLAGEKPVVKGLSPYPQKINCEWIKLDFPRNLQPQKHFTVAKKIDKIIKRIRPDLIHVHFSAAMFTVSLAKKDDWPPIIATIHGLAWPTRKGNTRLMLKRAELNAAKKMDQVLVLNKDDQELFNKNGIANSKILFDYGIGCNTQLFDQNSISERERNELRNKLNIRNDDCVFIFIGRQTKFKGYDNVIRAFMNIYHAKSKIHLLLIGDKDYIHETGLNQTEESLLSQIPSIHQIGWSAHIENYLAIADVNVFPSEREGFPVNLLESLSMGVPVITIDSRGCKEIIKHNENGIVVKNNKVSDLALAMKQLNENIVLRNSLSTKGIEKRDDYDRKKYIKIQIDFYAQYLHDAKKA